MIPALASDVVSRIEELGHEDVAEGADGEERGGLHLHDDRPLGPPRLETVTAGRQNIAARLLGGN
jgi:hypothetical protein